MGTTALAVMVRREKDIVRVFESVGATSAAAAKPLGALGLGESRHLERLQRHEVLRKGPPGTWYLDRAVWTARGQRRRRIAMVLLAVSLFALALGLGLLPTGSR